ncbi:KRAB-A domain-containing protein 2-like, partial [Aphis craccivora]
IRLSSFLREKKLKKIWKNRQKERKIYQIINLIPDVDRGRVVLKLIDYGFYQQGCNAGVLKQLYSRSQFTVCSENLLAVEAVPNESVLVPKNVTQSDVFVKKMRYRATLKYVLKYSFRVFCLQMRHVWTRNHRY